MHVSVVECVAPSHLTPGAPGRCGLIAPRSVRSHPSVWLCALPGVIAALVVGAGASYAAASSQSTQEKQQGARQAAAPAPMSSLTIGSACVVFRSSLLI